MELLEFKEIIKETQKFHHDDEDGNIDQGYFFDVERSTYNVSYKYFISEETKELWIEIYDAIDFESMVDGISTGIDYTSLKITLMTDELNLENFDVLKLLQIPFIESIELVNFDRAIQHITLKDIHIPHLYRLYFMSDIDHEDMGLTIQLQPSFKHRLEGFKGHLDTWDSFSKLTQSSYMSECCVHILDGKQPHYIYGKIESLSIHSFHPVHLVYRMMDVDHLQDLWLGLCEVED